MPAEVPRVRRKAAAVIDSLHVAREMFGPKMLAQVIAAVPQETRALAEQKLLPVTWIDYEAWFPFYEQLLAIACDGEEVRFRRFIRQVAERGFSTVYRMFIKLPSTDFVIDRTTKIWATLFDSGELRVVRRERDGDVRRIVVGLRVPLPRPLFGVILSEVGELLCHMNGAKSITTKTDLRVVGDMLEGEIRLTYT
jgi:hypothetical protein